MNVHECSKPLAGRLPRPSAPQWVLFCRLFHPLVVFPRRLRCCGALWQLCGSRGDSIAQQSAHHSGSVAVLYSRIALSHFVVTGCCPTALFLPLKLSMSPPSTPFPECSSNKTSSIPLSPSFWLTRIASFVNCRRRLSDPSVSVRALFSWHSPYSVFSLASHIVAYNRQNEAVSAVQHVAQGKKMPIAAPQTASGPAGNLCGSRKRSIQA